MILHTGELQKITVNLIPHDQIVNPTPDFRYGIGKHTSTEIFFKTNTIHSQAHSNPHFQVLADGTTSAMEKIFKGLVNFTFFCIIYFLNLPKV